MKSSLSLKTALLPLLVLIGLLAFNVLVYGDDALSGSNQFILLLGGAVAAMVGFANKISYKTMLDKVADNLKSVTGAILILLFVGALAGTWLISGVIPAMIYYGLQILHPSIFLPACVIICALISLATGSSWTTSATVGIALIGIGKALGVPVGMVAGAVLSGAYFGDKLSPHSVAIAYPQNRHPIERHQQPFLLERPGPFQSQSGQYQRLRKLSSYCLLRLKSKHK